MVGLWLHSRGRWVSSCRRQATRAHHNRGGSTTSGCCSYAPNARAQRLHAVHRDSDVDDEAATTRSTRLNGAAAVSAGRAGGGNCSGSCTGKCLRLECDGRRVAPAAREVNASRRRCRHPLAKGNGRARQRHGGWHVGRVHALGGEQLRRPLVVPRRPPRQVRPRLPLITQRCHKADRADTARGVCLRTGAGAAARAAAGRAPRELALQQRKRGQPGVIVGRA